MKITVVSLYYCCVRSDAYAFSDRRRAICTQTHVRPNHAVEIYTAQTGAVCVCADAPRVIAAHSAAAHPRGGIAVATASGLCRVIARFKFV